MARRSGRKSAAARVGRTITDVASIPKRLDDRVRPAATAVGWAGVAALAACLALRAAPEEDWPFGMAPARFPVYVTVALVAASLLGWSFLQEGQARIERSVGRTAGLVLFVFAPLAAAAAGIVEDRAALSPETRAEWATWFLVARWYSPAAVLASLLAFFTRRATRGSGLHLPRALWYGTLLVPYVVLFAALVFGFRFPWIDEPLHDTLGALGSGAIALQLVLAWFVGGTG